MVVLVLLLFAVQVIFDLYARSAVTSAAVDAARQVAGAAPDGGPGAWPASIGAAQARAETALGSYAGATRFAWALVGPDGTPDPVDPTEVRLTVSFDLARSAYHVTGPLTLPGLDHFERTVRVRIEHVVCPARVTCSVLPGAGRPADLGGTSP